MVTTPEVTPSLVFPLPGYTGNIAPHGGPQFTGGSDIFAPFGTPIVSIASGKVTFTSTSQSAPTSGGNAIEIQSPDGLTYYYAHMANAPLLKAGDTVVAGQQLGVVDNTGNAAHTQSHLHIGIGYGISTGIGAAGGLGQNFNAVALLQSLQKSPRSNNPAIIGGTPNPPTINFIPSIPGFSSNHLNDIFLNMQEALKKGIDPFIWLGIVSKESSFDPNAINPTSGACGYSQIYPCIPNLTPVQNIDEGIKRLQGFLNQCSGDINCALNLYSGGAGQSYITDVLGRASAIKQANPSLSSDPSSFDPTLSTGVGAINVGQTGSPLPVCTFKGITDLPNFIVCIVNSSIHNIENQLAQWWQNWQTQNLANIVFVGLGTILIVVGLLGIVNSKSGSVTGSIQANMKENTKISAMELAMA